MGERKGVLDSQQASADVKMLESGPHMGQREELLLGEVDNAHGCGHQLSKAYTCKPCIIRGPSLSSRKPQRAGGVHVDVPCYR